jgi:mannose-6-phosphate isomerase
MKLGEEMQRANDNEAGPLPPRAAIGVAHARLQRWLFDDALPLWLEKGADPAGGFHDRLNLDATPAPAPRRLRVQARQVFVYALASRLGWSGEAAAAAERGLDVVIAARQGADGIYRLGPPRSPDALDGMGELYDQAFVLLALASAQGLLGGGHYETLAQELRWSLATFAAPFGGFAEAPGLAAPLFANPNMHLYEACQAWVEMSFDPDWRSLSTGLTNLALERLIDPASGVLYERYDADWRIADRPEDRLVWPGHLYEWAFLLLNCPHGGPASLEAAVRLIELAERHGVDPERGVAIFALDGNLAPVDRGARLWAQTERLRACLRAAALTGNAAFWQAASEACGALEAFLDVPTPGLWRDWMDEAGRFREEPAPASSLYHIVGAIAELGRQSGGSA